MKLMLVEMAEKIGESIGKVMVIDETKTLICGRFLRIRVLLDISKLIRRGVMVAYSERKLWIEVKYERLPNFCYTCGRMRHVDIDYDDEEAKGYQNEYGEWLRVSPLKINDRAVGEKAKELQLVRS